LQSDRARAQAERQTHIAATLQRITALQGRMDQMYEDKLDGKIDDEFWTRKTNECREQERRLESEMSSLKAQVGAENVLTVKKIFELANRAHFLYFTRNQAERGQLVKSVLLNCDTDGVSLWAS
jgi:site-specific DNA recombinase